MRQMRMGEARVLVAGGVVLSAAALVGTAVAASKDSSVPIDGTTIETCVNLSSGALRVIKVLPTDLSWKKTPAGCKSKSEQELDWTVGGGGGGGGVGATGATGPTGPAGATGAGLPGVAGATGLHGRDRPCRCRHNRSDRASRRGRRDRPDGRDRPCRCNRRRHNRSNRPSRHSRPHRRNRAGRCNRRRHNRSDRASRRDGRDRPDRRNRAGRCNRRRHNRSDRPSRRDRRDRPDRRNRAGRCNRRRRNRSNRPDRHSRPDRRNRAGRCDRRRHNRGDGPSGCDRPGGGNLHRLASRLGHTEVQRNSDRADIGELYEPVVRQLPRLVDADQRDELRSGQRLGLCPAVRRRSHRFQDQPARQQQHAEERSGGDDGRLDRHVPEHVANFGRAGSRPFGASRPVSGVDNPFRMPC